MLKGGVTHREIFLGELAHVVGQKDTEKSPRGTSDLSQCERDSADNLMLVCADEHDEIDNRDVLDVANSSASTRRGSSTSPGLVLRLPPRRYAVAVRYHGNADYRSSWITACFTITKAKTAIKARATPRSASAGKSVILSVIGLPMRATGRVTFRSGRAMLCVANVWHGAASCRTSTELPPGRYSVTARYAGNAGYSSSGAKTSFAVTSTR